MQTDRRAKDDQSNCVRKLRYIVIVTVVVLVTIIVTAPKEKLWILTSCYRYCLILRGKGNGNDNSKCNKIHNSK